AKNYETRREPAVQRHLRFARDGERGEHAPAKARDGGGLDRDERRIDQRGTGRGGLDREERRDALREFSKLERRRGGRAGRTAADRTADPSFGNERVDLIDIVIARERKRDRPGCVEAERAGTPRGDDELRCRR